MTALDKRPDGFDLRLANGEGITAKSVVIATGLSDAEYIPQELAEFPEELRSHSRVHHHLSQFKGREVVVGAGHSALENAALLSETQASASALPHPHRQDERRRPASLDRRPYQPAN